MQIDTISYERRVSDHDYGNRMFRASATLGENDNPDEAALVLRGFVCDQIEADEKAEREREEAERKRLYEEREARYAREREERTAMMGRDVAITVPVAEDDEIPFDDDEEDEDDDDD